MSAIQQFVEFWSCHRSEDCISNWAHARVYMNVTYTVSRKAKPHTRVHKIHPCIYRYIDRLHTRNKSTRDCNTDKRQRARHV